MKNATLIFLICAGLFTLAGCSKIETDLAAETPPANPKFIPDVDVTLFAIIRSNFHS